MAISTSRFDIRQAGKQIGLALGALALLNLGFYFFYTRPAVTQYSSLLEGSGMVNLEAVGEFRDLVERREAYLAALRKAESDLLVLRNDVLSTSDERMVVVQEEIDRLASQFQIDGDRVNYSSQMLIGEELDRFTVDVPLEGNYSSLRKFLQAVENSDNFLVVERVALAKGREGGVTLQLNITLVTYFNLPQYLIDRKREIDRGSRRGRRS